MRNSKNQFIRSLGYLDPHPGDQLYSALMLQPRVVGGLTVIGLLFQTPWLFLALSAALWWSALVPTRSLFDADLQLRGGPSSRSRAVGASASPSSFRRRTGWGGHARDWRCTPGGSQEHSLGARSPVDSRSGSRRVRTILRRRRSLPCPASTLGRRRAHGCGAAPLRVHGASPQARDCTLFVQATRPPATGDLEFQTAGLFGCGVYCLSNTVMLVTFLPAASVVSVVSVRVLPSAENATVPVSTTLPPLLFVSA